MYGNRLTRDFGDSVPDPWRSAITTLNDYQIQRGLRRLTEHGSGSTPTLPQFVKACRDTSGDPIVPEVPALPELTPDNFTLFGNHLLFNFLMRYPQPVSDASLRELVKAKDKIVADFRLISTEDTVEGVEMQRALHAKWNELVKPASDEEMQENREHFARTNSAKDRWVA